MNAIRLLLLAALVLGWPSSAFAVIAHDVTTTGGSSSTTSSCTTSHTAAASGVTIALAWLGLDGGEAVSGATYGGDAMTFIGQSGALPLGSDENIFLWARFNPKQGTQSVVMSHDSDNHDVCIVKTFSGTLLTSDAIAQFGSYDNGGAACTSAAVTLTLAATTNFMVSASVWQGGDVTPITTYTNCDNQRSDFHSGVNDPNNDDSMNDCESTGDTGSFTHTIDDNLTDECAMFSVELTDIEPPPSTRRVWTTQ